MYRPTKSTSMSLAQERAIRRYLNNDDTCGLSCHSVVITKLEYCNYCCTVFRIKLHSQCSCKNNYFREYYDKAKILMLLH